MTGHPASQTAATPSIIWPIAAGIVAAVVTVGFASSMFSLLGSPGDDAQAVGRLAGKVLLPAAGFSGAGIHLLQRRKLAFGLVALVLGVAAALLPGGLFVARSLIHGTVPKALGGDVADMQVTTRVVFNPRPDGAKYPVLLQIAGLEENEAEGIIASLKPGTSPGLDEAQ